jgi:hypothetical protein
MFANAFSTTGSRAAGGSLMLLLLISLALINGFEADEALQWSLFYMVAALAGCALGWIAGDTFANSSAFGRVAVGIGVLVVTAVGLLLPALRQVREAGSFDLVELFYNLLGRHVQSGSTAGVAAYTTVAFLLAAIVAGIVARKGDHAPPPARASDASALAAATSLDRRHQAMIAWGTIGSAVGTGVAVLALGFGLVQLMIAENRWQKEVTVNVLSQENADKPYTSRHCLQALNSLDGEQLKQLSQREPVVLQEQQRDFMRRCFADQEPKQRELLYSAGTPVTLTEKGAALLAQRVNYTLIKDSLIASLLKYRMGDRGLVNSELRARLCGYDKLIVERLSKVDLPDYPGKTIFDEEDSLHWLVVKSGFCRDRTR